jgi:hypothetical protein
VRQTIGRELAVSFGKIIGKEKSFDSDGVISFFADGPIKKFGKPPNSLG